MFMFPRSLLALLLLTALFGGCDEQLGARRPNVIFILTDDQRWDMLGSEGHPYLETPHLDRLAREGARFANMFVTTSLCSPSRASFLSGLYARTHKVSNNFTDYPADLPSFPRRLQEEGYETAYIGKWHMGEKSDEKRPGFDYWISHSGQGKYFDNEFNVDGERKVVKGYYTTVVTDMALEWLRRPREKDQPFLLILGHKAPHTPYTPEPKYQGIYDDVEIPYPPSAFQLDDKPKWMQERIDTWHGIYGPCYGYRKKFPDRSPEGVKAFADFVKAYTATIRSIDDSTGRLYDALKKMRILDDTLIVFAGDNGSLNGEHGMTDKRAMQEESIRVPMLVRYPRLTGPKVVHEMVLNIDLAPSILDICRAKPLEKVDGMSWKPLLEGRETEWRTSFLYEYNYEKQFPYTPNVRGVRTREWKYIRYPHGDGGEDRHMAELYNIAGDPGEHANLINKPEYAGKVKELRAELERLSAEIGPDTMPLDEGIQKKLPDKKIR